MFEAITEKFQNLTNKLTRSKKLTEDNIAEAVRDVRLALLDADVNYSVASALVKKIKDRSLGETLIKAVKPAQQFTKIVHDELVSLMGQDEVKLNLNGYPSCIMLCGLQGSGKTTQSVKLAKFLKNTDKKKKILLMACDLQRPAAIEQLKKLASTIDVEVFSIDKEKDPRKIAKKGIEKAKKEAFDVLIADTAGRLHVDEDLMKELKDIKDILNPQEVLFVASAATGQDAVKTAAEFDKQVSITGSILTMLDGNARSGAAISIYEVTKKPLKFEGIGEKIDDLQVFNPKSMADRILGMGDVINLVRKAESAIDEKESIELEKKFRKASFTFEDYLKQMKTIKRMGSIKSLLKMLPGFSSMSQFDVSDKELKKVEAMILSMTKQERVEKVDLIHSRRKRIANGSGIALDDVNRLIKSFKRMKQFMKKMPSFKKSLSSGGNFDIKKQLEDVKWP